MLTPPGECVRRGHAALGCRATTTLAGLRLPRGDRLDLRRCRETRAAELGRDRHRPSAPASSGRRQRTLQYHGPGKPGPWGVRAVDAVPEMTEGPAQPGRAGPLVGDNRVVAGSPLRTDRTQEPRMTDPVSPYGSTVHRSAKGLDGLTDDHPLRCNTGTSRSIVIIIGLVVYHYGSVSIGLTLGPLVRRRVRPSAPDGSDPFMSNAGTVRVTRVWVSTGAMMTARTSPSGRSP